MAPYKRRVRFTAKRDKYSVEQQAGTIAVPANQQAWVQVVPDTTIGGMRKVKHLTVSLASTGAGGSTVGFWALVYVPQGTTPSTVSITGTSFYEPNQFVMNCGTFDSNAGPVRLHSRISRNLNSGDKIVLILANPSGSAADYQFCVRYAITLQ